MQSKFDQISMKIWSKLVEFVSDLISGSDLIWSFDLIWSDLIRSKFLIKFLDRISGCNFLIKFLDPSFRSCFGRLGSNFHRTWSNCLSDPISDLSWPDHLIWSVRMWSDRNYWSNFLTAFLVQVCWSNFLIHLSDHDSFSYRSLQISRSTLLIILSDQFPFCSDRFFTAFKFLVQICWSSFPIMCLFLLTPFSITVNGYWRVLTSIYIYIDIDIDIDIDR